MWGGQGVAGQPCKSRCGLHAPPPPAGPPPPPPACRHVLNTLCCAALLLCKHHLPPPAPPTTCTYPPATPILLPCRADTATSPAPHMAIAKLVARRTLLAGANAATLTGGAAGPMRRPPLAPRCGQQQAAPVVRLAGFPSLPIDQHLLDPPPPCVGWALLTRPFPGLLQGSTANCPCPSSHACFRLPSRPCSRVRSRAPSGDDSQLSQGSADENAGDSLNTAGSQRRCVCVACWCRLLVSLAAMLAVSLAATHRDLCPALPCPAPGACPAAPCCMPCPGLACPPEYTQALHWSHLPPSPYPPLSPCSKRPRRAASGGVLGAVAAEASEWGLDIVSPPLKRANSLPVSMCSVCVWGGGVGGAEGAVRRGVARCSALPAQFHQNQNND